MTLATMTIDEAIADCVRQVPECAPGPVPGREAFNNRGELVENALVPPGYFRALWFHAAWVWVSEHPSSNGWPPNIVRWSDGWAIGIHQRSSYIEPPTRFPTEYHALHAAVLMAKGLKP